MASTFKSIPIPFRTSWCSTLNIELRAVSLIIRSSGGKFRINSSAAVGVPLRNGSMHDAANLFILDNFCMVWPSVQTLDHMMLPKVRLGMTIP